MVPLLAAPLLLVAAPATDPEEVPAALAALAGLVGLAAVVLLLLLHAATLTIKDAATQPAVQLLMRILSLSPVGYGYSIAHGACQRSSLLNANDCTHRCTASLSCQRQMWPDLAAGRY
jgi:hypothetical protein